MNTQQRIEVERKIVAFLFNTMSQHGWHVDYIFDGGDNVRSVLEHRSTDQF